VEVDEKIVGIVFGDLPDGLAFSFGAFFELVFAFVSIGGEVADVSDVEDAVFAPTIGAEGANERIPIDVGGEVADVLVVVDRGAAGVDFDVLGVLRAKIFEFAGEGVEKFHDLISKSLMLAVMSSGRTCSKVS